MDPRDVNRINYNNYYVGQNLDFLVRSKMRSESLSTPLKNTPPFYDAEVSSKMSLLGKRGYIDPGYIYGFEDSNQSENNQYDPNYYNRMPNEEFSNPNLPREPYNQVNSPKEQYNNKNLNNYEMSNNPNNNYHNYYKERNLNDNMNNNGNNNIGIRNKYNDEMLYKEKLEMLKERQTPQKLDNFQLERIQQNRRRSYEEEENKYNINKKNEEMINEEDPKYKYGDINKEREYYEMIMRNNNGMERNKDKIPNQDYSQQIREYNYITELSKRNTGDLVLPLTKNQILQEVYTENFNKKHLSK